MFCHCGMYPVQMAAHALIHGESKAVTDWSRADQSDDEPVAIVIFAAKGTAAVTLETE